MNPSPRHEKEDILINFRDLLVHVLLRWRSILAVAVLLTFVAGGGKFWLDYREYQNALNAPTATAPTLSAIEQANVDNAFGYHKAYEAVVAYNKASPLMHIDYTAAPTTILNFAVQDDNSYNYAQAVQTVVREESATILEAEGILADTNSSIIRDSYELMGSDAAPVADTAYTAPYLTELVTTTVLYQTDAATAPREPVVLQVKVLGINEEFCREIADKLAASIRALPGCTLLDSRYYVAVDTGIKTTQINNLNVANNLRTAYKGAREALSSQESAALEKRIQGETSEGGAAQPAKPSVSKKILLLGFVAGGALMVVLYILGYLTDRRVKSPEDLQERFGLYHMGALPESGKSRFLDRFITGLFRKKSTLTAEEAHALTVEQLRLAAKNGSVLITGSALTRQDAVRLQPLVAALKEVGVALSIVPCPLQDAAAMEALSKTGAVVLAEKERLSSYNNIYAVLELCQRLEIPVRGTLLV